VAGSSRQMALHYSSKREPSICRASWRAAVLGEHPADAVPAHRRSPHSSWTISRLYLHTRHNPQQQNAGMNKLTRENTIPNQSAAALWVRWPLTALHPAYAVAALKRRSPEPITEYLPTTSASSPADGCRRRSGPSVHSQVGVVDVIDLQRDASSAANCCPSEAASQLAGPSTPAAARMRSRTFAPVNQPNPSLRAARDRGTYGTVRQTRSPGSYLCRRATTPVMSEDQQPM
jgi:hypothetical protein